MTVMGSLPTWASFAKASLMLSMLSSMGHPPLTHADEGRPANLTADAQGIGPVRAATTADRVVRRRAFAHIFQKARLGGAVFAGNIILALPKYLAVDIDFVKGLDTPLDRRLLRDSNLFLVGAGLGNIQAGDAPALGFVLFHHQAHGQGCRQELFIGVLVGGAVYHTLLVVANVNHLVEEDEQKVVVVNALKLGPDDEIFRKVAHRHFFGGVDDDGRHFQNSAEKLSVDGGKRSLDLPYEWQFGLFHRQS